MYKKSILASDGYKFSMAEAGWPLRQETFYYSQRRGGPSVLPFDVCEELEKALPEAPTANEWEWLAEHGYAMGAAYRSLMAQVGTDEADQQHTLRVCGLPEGSIFHEREPAFSLTGPSALVSWLEPQILSWHYRIQVATRALSEPQNLPALVGEVTCEEQRELVLATLDHIGVRAPEIQVRSAEYRERVILAARGLVHAVGDPARIFEVGMRAASCMEQHRIALEACQSVGIAATSNVWLAHKLGMRPIGTMGHEHVQRYRSDEAAFRAMRERRAGPASFLVDTSDSLRSGIPCALALMAEEPARGDALRYDSGDKLGQHRFVAERAKELGLQPIHILEDSFDEELTRKFEAQRLELGIAAEQQLYGYGGYLVARPAPGGRHALTIWPLHALLGGTSHALSPVLMEAALYHAIARRSAPQFLTKGQAAISESFSVFRPEVRELLNPNLGRSQTVSGDKSDQCADLLDHDRLYVFGQASSHCVRATLQDLVEFAREQGCEERLARVFILTDAMSPVPSPALDPLPAELDFPKVAERALEEFVAAGMQLARTTDPIGLD